MLRRAPHQAENEAAPELFARARRPDELLGSLALPAETITAASALAYGFLFFWLSWREAYRFFFRLSFSPAWLAGFATLFAIIIWADARSRCGPRLPSVWMLIVTLVNVAVLALSMARQKFPGELPGWVQDPWPLDPLAVSGVAAVAILLLRLVRMHPLKSAVLTMAPRTLGLLLCALVPSCVLFIDNQMNIERRTLTDMAGKINAAANHLSAAARFPYSDLRIINEYQQSHLRVDTALAGLREPPERLALPAGKRWDAARILENENKLSVGELESATRNLVDALNRLLTSEQIPELRTGRYLPVDDRYVLNDQFYAKQTNRPKFAAGAEIGTAYYSNLAKWLAHTRALRSGPVSDYYRSRVDEVLEARRTEFYGRVARQWWAQLLVPRPNPNTPPPLQLRDVFETPLLTGGLPLAQVNQWNSLNWGGLHKTNLIKGGPCRQVSWKIENEQQIPAPQELLTKAQLESGVPYFIGVTFDASAVAQCFGYHAPVASSGTLLVVELRLTYAVRGKEHRATQPCDSPCWAAPTVPYDTPLTAMDLFIDEPDSAAQSYPEEAWNEFVASVGRLSGDPLPAIQPQRMPQSPSQTVVHYKLR